MLSNSHKTGKHFKWQYHKEGRNIHNIFTHSAEYQNNKDF